MGLSHYLDRKRLGGIVIGMSLGLLFWIIVSVVSSDFAQNVSEVEFALIILQLTALALPGLAIILQASLSYSRQKRYRLTGQTQEIQYLFFGIIGISAFLLAISVYIISESVELSSGISFSLLLVNISLFGFASIPIVIAGYEYIHKDDEFMKIIQAVEFAEIQNEAKEIDDKILTSAFESFGVEEYSNENNDRDSSDNSSNSEHVSSPIKYQ